MSWYGGGGQPIVIKRQDVQKVHDWARDNRSLRDYLFIRLPMKIGLRTREIATLTVEDINFEDRSFQVLDSKKHRFYPLPLDPLTLQLIKDLVGAQSEGLVFQHKTYKHKREGKPLTNVTIWKMIKSIGEAAGVEGFHPRILRHHFAVDWHIVQKKSIEVLRQILRHKNLAVTHRYLSRLVVFEDMQQEYAELRNGPILETTQISVSLKFRGNKNYEEFCSRCDREPVCKFLPDFCSSLYATSCKHFLLKDEIKLKAIERARQNHKLS